MTGLTPTNLALAGVVALLVLVAVFGPDPTRESAPEPLTKLDPAVVRHIRIDRNTDGALAFQRGAEGWRMSEPYRIAANGDKLQALARIASAPSRRSFPAGQTDLAEFGLAPAPLRLELDDVILEIGGTEPIRRRRYLRLEGRIHLIDDLFLHHLLAPAEVFVDPRPFPRAVHSANLDSRPMTAEALQLMNGSRAARVIKGVAPTGTLQLEVRMKGRQSPLNFRLTTDGERLWREHPPLLYRLKTPVIPDILRQ